jgi:intein/homing endonuclease
MTKKRKILFCAEAHWMPTGFGTYTWEILSRLHATGKFEIAEFSQFATVNHPEDRARWRLYANAIKPDDPRTKHYNAHPYNVYGAWRFERVLVDFKCDCCVSFLDPWMMLYQYVSPLRPYFHHILMPTVDSAPQDEDWINMFSTADDVFTYSDWAVKTLKEQGGDSINVHCKTPPGTDHNLFKPLDKKSIRKEMGINPEWNIVGTVMRNQRRKLYPDLLLAFKKFLQICEDNGQSELANKTYMLWHTGYPDAGWNIPLILRESGIAHKVLFSYVCGSCGHWHISTFKEMAAICPNCHKTTMHLASVGKGLDRSLLPKLYNLMDLYIQYAVCLGKNEEILTEDGWIPISNIKVGQRVWTHKHQWKPVLNVWKNLPKSENKDIFKIDICGDYHSLIATQNHEFYAVTQNEIMCSKGCNIRTAIGTNLRLNKNNICFDKTYELSELTVGDMLVYPIDDTTQDIESIDWIVNTPSIKETIDKDKFIDNDNIFNRYSMVDEDFCKFIGLYVADGSSNLKRGSIKITSHIKDIDNQNLAINIFNKLKGHNRILGIRKYKNRNANDVYIHSHAHAQKLLGWCKNHHDKQLPQWTLHLPPNKQKSILQGLFMGDGHFIHKKNTSIYCTTSYVLSEQIKHILRRLRINYNVRMIDKNKYNHSDNYNRHTQYRFEVSGDVKRGEFISKRTNTQNIYIDNYHLLKIKNIQHSNYCEDVWNLDVEDDHSMTTRIGVTKQCEGFGMSIPEAASCSVPLMVVNYSAMEDFVDTLGATPITPFMFRELETHALRALPHNDECAEKIYKFFTSSDEYRKEKGNIARQGVIDNYSYDKTAKIWENFLESVPLKGQPWDSPPKFIPKQNKIPELSNDQLAKWIILEMLKEPEKLNTYYHSNLLYQLSFGVVRQGRQMQSMSREVLMENLQSRVGAKNYWEQVRTGQIVLPTEDFIDYAHLKDEI